MRRLLLRMLAGIAFLAPVASGFCDVPGRFPFVLPWDDAGPSVINVGALNPVPAGVNGFIRARDGHFYDEKSKRIRFIGVNMAGAMAFPTKPDAEKIAAHLHKYGINIVRLHHMDAEWSKPNIFAQNSGGTEQLNPDALDRLDYFIYQLKQNGIFSNINLKVSRRFTARDGLPDATKLQFGGKPADYYMPRMIELQKNFAAALLTHVNPYTKTRYVEEPAIAVVELNNENSILGEPWDRIGGGLKTLPAPYITELETQWNRWLTAKYKDSPAMKRSWQAADKPIGPNRLLNTDFSQGAEHWDLEMNTAPATARMELLQDATGAPGAPGRPIRLEVSALGKQDWNIQFYQNHIDLTDGEPYTVSFLARADRPRNLRVYSGVDVADFHEAGLSATAEVTKQWQRFTFIFNAARTEKAHNRLCFVLGGALGVVELQDISLRPGQVSPFPADARLEDKNIPLGQPAASPAGQDWIAFLIDIERRYNADMTDFLRNTLKVRANITGSQTAWGGLAGPLRESKSDFADMHAYWQHPVFPHAAFDVNDWSIFNTSMIADPNGGILPGLARYRMAGKPYTISEYSHPAPSDFQAETVPVLAAFASVQDWDGFYLFDYGMDRGENKIASWFTVDANPSKMAFLPAAACMFLRNDVALANEELRLRIPADSVPMLIAKYGLDSSAEWEAAGVHNLDALNHRLSISFLPKSAAQPARFDEHNSAEFIKQPEARSAIQWKPDADKPTFVTESPFSKVMVGFLGGQAVTAPGWQTRMSEAEGNFAAMTLTAMDGKPIDHSFSLLLTAVSRVENTGMEWNKDRTSVGNRWGTGPTLAEGITAEVRIHTLVTSAAVYALDGTGKRVGVVPSKLLGSELSFLIEPKYKTVWYEVEANIKR